MRTLVELCFVEGQAERWIRFGKWAEEQAIDARRRMVSFDPGEIFAMVTWYAGEHGAALSRIDIVRCLDAPHSCEVLPFVGPGGERLLHLQGWSKSQAVLQAIDNLERRGFEPRDATPHYWRHLHRRLSAGLAPRACDPRCHRAGVRRREITR